MNSKDTNQPSLRIPSSLWRNLGMPVFNLDHLCQMTRREILLSPGAGSDDVDQLERELARIGRSLASSPSNKEALESSFGRYEVSFNVWVPLADDEHDPIGVVSEIGELGTRRLDLLQALEASAELCSSPSERDARLSWTAADLRRIADYLDQMVRSPSTDPANAT